MTIRGWPLYAILLASGVVALLVAQFFGASTVVAWAGLWLAATALSLRRARQTGSTSAWGVVVVLVAAATLLLTFIALVYAFDVEIGS
jgi:hypothetical protein